MGLVLDFNSYAQKLRARDRVTELKPDRRDGVTAEIHIWDGIRIERFSADLVAETELSTPELDVGHEKAGS